MNLIERIRAEHRHYTGASLWVNWKVGYIDSHIKGAAAAVPVELDTRIARMELAAEVFGRKIESYKDLSGEELEAIFEITATRGLELKTWIQKKYGAQLEMDFPK